MKATLPNGTSIEGTPEEMERFISKPSPYQLLPQVIPNPMPYQPSYPDPYPWWPGTIIYCSTSTDPTTARHQGKQQDNCFRSEP